MSSFPFPSNPSNGDTYTLGTNTYTYSSATDQWTGVAATGGALQLASVITTSTTFTIPSGVTSIKATVVGGGGGGVSFAFGVPGGGGGGGGTAIKYLNGLTPGGSITVTIGAAGVVGGDGGTTSIVVNGTTISATGGVKGITSGSNYRSTGGVGSNGDINIGGTGGSPGTPYGGGVGGSSILGGGGAGGADSAPGSDASVGRSYGGGGGGGGTGGLGAAGAPGVVIFEYTIASTGGNSSGLQSGTAQNSTSGTSIDFTGIPSWAKRITVMFNSVRNTSGTSYLVQIGSGSFVTSGYTSISNQATVTNTVQTAYSSSGFVMYGSGAADLMIGQVVLTLVSANIWIASHTATRAGWVVNGAGSVSLSGILDRVRITSTSGTDAFNGGSINILYE